MRSGNGQTSADPVDTQCLQATCCLTDGAVQEQKQARCVERTCHSEAGACGSRSRAGLLVLLMLFLATILLASSSPELRAPKEPFGLAVLLAECNFLSCGSESQLRGGIPPGQMDNTKVFLCFLS